MKKRGKRLIEDFKAFAFKGNVIDMAVGVIIGGAFGKIVSSIVNDLLMPLLGAVAKVDIAHWYILLRPGADGMTAYDGMQAALDAGAVVWAYGNFISVVLDFFFIAISVFLFVRLIAKLTSLGKKTEGEAAPPPPPEPRLCPYCKMEVHLEASKCPYCGSEI
ncbi:MAG: large conductance mechanosensitive channel protein MscL [Clostridiales bacterium]|nr:large conductance mechanosensitive channel protein MscL [Clostridiales bacterium]